MKHSSKIQKTLNENKNQQMKNSNKEQQKTNINLHYLSCKDKSKRTEPILTGGMCSCQGVGAGRARIVTLSENPNDSEISAINERIKYGDVLIINKTVPALVLVMKKLSALVTEFGGCLCHAAIISREMGIPSIVGVNGVVDRLRGFEGSIVTVNSFQTAIYEGEPPMREMDINKDIDLCNTDKKIKEGIKNIINSLGERGDKTPIYRPYHSIGKLQMELYIKAFDELFNILHVNCETFIEDKEDGKWLYTNRKLGIDHMKAVEALGIDGMKKVLEQREKAVNRFQKICFTFDHHDEKVNEFIDAYIGMIAYFHFRWIFKNALEKKFLEQKLTLSLIERQYIDQVLSFRIATAKTEKSKGDRLYQDLLCLAREYSEIFNLNDERRIIESLENEQLLEYLKRFASDFPQTDNVDIRLGFSLSVLLKRIKEDIRAGYTIDEMATPIYPSEIIQMGYDTQKIFELYVDQIIQTENEHIIQIRGQFKIRKKLLEFGIELVKLHGLNAPEDIFDLNLSEFKELVGLLQDR